MGEKLGRKGMYVTHVEPHFAKIEKLLNQGATEKQVAESLGVSYASWCNYKRDYKALRELCEKPRTELVDDLKGALVKRALGFTYEEKKAYKRRGDDGSEYTYVETQTKQALPDVTAIFGALKIYDKDKLDYDIQAQSIELKRMEFELKKEIAKDEWK